MKTELLKGNLKLYKRTQRYQTVHGRRTGWQKKYCSGIIPCQSESRRKKRLACFYFFFNLHVPRSDTLRATRRDHRLSG